MAKTNKQINKEAEVSDVGSTPAVIAYRVAQLEMTQKEGFQELKDKLDSYVAGFVTEKEYQEAKSESRAEHLRLQKQIDDISKTAKWLVGIFLTVVGLAITVVALIIN